MCGDPTCSISLPQDLAGWHDKQIVDRRSLPSVRMDNYLDGWLSDYLLGNTHMTDMLSFLIMIAAVFLTGMYYGRDKR